MIARLVLILGLCCLGACGGNSRAPVEYRVPDAAAAPSSVYSVQRGDTLYSIAFRYGLDYRRLAAANNIAAPFTIYPGQVIALTETQRPAVTPAVAVATPVPTHAPTPAVPTGVTPSPSPAAPASSQSPTPVSGPVPLPVPVATSPSVPSPAGSPTTATTTPVAAGQKAPGSEAFAGGKVSTWLWPSTGQVSRSYSSSLHKGIDISGSRGDPVVAVAAGKVVYAGTGIAGLGELLIVKHNDVYLSAYGHNDRLLVAEGDVVGAGQRIAEKGSSGTDTVKLHFEIREAGKPIDPQRLLPRR